ncbi:hypothetical protein ASE36_05330 [Rhizobium sp. Root274]|uniref:NnrS family protein n=1 Tax=unclassified Rhizobium TaxID=2613769 RepID=UPI000713CDC8|nr:MULTISPECIES: NnrS family protein [unclassified Rhizobium]KQW31657.1 hypothetical protein ASC71_05335 [Rhizobium sp. Root1240]KRD33198.1 hypothetical protein ASE36_05330 [Rhizobium sp. Root274]
MHSLPPRSVSETLLSGGYRLFFPGSAIAAALAVALWVPWYLGLLDLPVALPPLAWHQHELLFGFVPGVVAGFLLTAVPNWTGRAAIAGRPLLCLFLLWLAGRIAIALSGSTGLIIAAPIACLFLPAFAVMIGRELAAAGNRRNYKILVILALLSLAQVCFFVELDQFGDTLVSARLAVATIVLMVSIVSGRIIPAFTGNWLKANRPGLLPVPFSRFDAVVIVLSLVTLLAWVIQARASLNFATPLGVLMIAVSAAHLVRQFRWRPLKTLREPILWILHLGYFFIPIGFLLMGSSLLLDDQSLTSAGIHAWTVGGIGIMILAVMTRATRGHTGLALHAPWTTTWFIYAFAIIAASARISAALLPTDASALLSVAGIAWIVAFLGYVVFYGSIVLRSR